jgi:hypothetical protein
MVAPGLPTYKVEMEFTAGVWTDVTADVKGAPSMHRGRSSVFDSLQPATFGFTLENIPNASGVGDYTPDNPLSSHWPNMVENKRVRWTLTKSAVAYVPLIAWITSITPSISGELNTATIDIVAVDLLGLYQNRPLRSDYAEKILADNTSTGCDLYLFDDGTPTSTVLANVGNRAAAPFASIFLAQGSDTSYGFGAPNTLNLDGGFQPTPVVTGGSGSLYSTGPVIVFDQAGSAQSIEFWVISNCPSDASAYILLADAGGGSVVGMAQSGSDLVFYFGAAVVVTAVVANDGLPHHIRLLKNGSNWDGYIEDVNYGHGAGIPYWSTASRGYLGGSGGNGSTYCPPNTTFAGLAVNYDSSSSHRVYGLQNQTVAASSRFAELCGYHKLTPSTTVLGTDDRLVIRKNTVGLSLLAVLDELVTTIQGALVVNGSTGVPTLRQPDSARPTTVTFTATLESDDSADAGIVFQRDVNIIPTRVTVDSPVGTLVAVNTTAETAGTPPRALPLSSASSDLTQARSLAYAYLSITSTLRLEALTVDLQTAEHDLYAAVLGNVLIGSRLRVANVPPSYFGRSYLDQYIQGYTLTAGVADCLLTLDASPADSPSEAKYLDATYGRYASPGSTVTSGTAVGGVGNGTIVVTTPTGSAWTTTSGEWPMDLDWNGERVTVTAAPGSSTSPQTMTITARGVAPTVARVHTTGEVIDVYLAARYAF